MYFYKSYVFLQIIYISTNHIYLSTNHMYVYNRTSQRRYLRVHDHGFLFVQITQSYVHVYPTNYAYKSHNPTYFYESYLQIPPTNHMYFYKSYLQIICISTNRTCKSYVFLQIVPANHIHSYKSYLQITTTNHMYFTNHTCPGPAHRARASLVEGALSRGVGAVGSRDRPYFSFRRQDGGSVAGGEQV